MSDYEHAFVFVDNHDNQRGHGGGGQVVVRKLLLIKRNFFEKTALYFRHKFDFYLALALIPG